MLNFKEIAAGVNKLIKYRNANQRISGFILFKFEYMAFYLQYVL